MAKAELGVATAGHPDAEPGGRARTVHLCALLAVSGSVAGALYALHLGQDQNWDWFNYHFYNVFALLNRRLLEDVNAAGIQTYLNPILYFPQYFARKYLTPATAAAALAALQGLNVPLLWLVARELLPGEGSRRWALHLLAVVIGVTGAATLSEVGTSFADVLTSLPVLAGVLLILRGSSGKAPRACGPAGLLIGLAIGLKLTNMIFAVGAAAAVAVGPAPLRGLVRLAVGGVCGTLIAGGPWALFLWNEFGSPTFPFFDGAFQAPDGPGANLLDARFLPTGVVDGLLYPFYLLLAVQRTTEIPMRDPRFALAGVLVAMVAIHLLRTVRARRGRTTVAAHTLRSFGAFFLVSYGLWLVQFSIQRYAVVLEMLSGPLIVLLLDRMVRGRLKTAAVVATTVGLVAWTQPPDWSRRPWSTPYAGPALPSPLTQPAAVFLLDKPLAYLAGYLPPESRVHQLSEMPIRPDGRFDRQIRRALQRTWPGGVWVVHFDGAAPEDVAAQLANYGLAPDPTSCVKLEDGLFGDPIACRLRER